MCKKLLFVAMMSILLLCSMSMAQVDVTGPLDVVVGVPDDGITTGGDDNGWPPNELPKFAIDDQILTKYLHFKGDVEPTGIRVTPAMGSTVVTGVRFCSANDTTTYRGRAPVTYELSGSNESIDGPYTLIAKGDIEDFSGPTPWPDRTWTTTPMTFANTTAYKHYQLLFPTTWNRLYGTTDSCMQIAEVELLMDLYTAYNPSPADRAIYQDTWATLSWTAGHDAASHELYISDNLADVQNSAPEAFQGELDKLTTYFIVGFPGFPFPDGLVPGTTYYWRVDEINEDNPASPWVGDIWSFTVPPKIAWKPNPPDGGQFIDTETDLSWNPGWGAKLHTVYFGDNFDDVNNASGGTAQIGTSYALNTLEMNKKYFWRVDESDGRQMYPGHVWSFTTTSGGGGIKGEYFNNTNLTGSPVLTRIDQQVDFSFGAASPGLPVPATGWSARWTADLNVLSTDTYTFSVNSEGGTRLWIDGEQILNMWVSWVPTEYAGLPIHLEAGVHTLLLEYYHYSNGEQHLYWRTPTMAKQIIPAGPLQPPTKANMPSPPNNAKNVEQTPLLKWAAGDNAASSQLYFGTDEQVVRDANSSSPEYKGSIDLGAEIYDPGLLAWDTDYYWRVDGVNDLDAGSPWVGIVWTFKTAGFLVIDDFEDYDIGNKEIWWSWKDGLGYGAHGDEPAYAGNGTGSAVGDEGTASYMEESIVHGGFKSMPVAYNNTIAKYSEVELTLDGMDLTQNGGSTLRIFFNGIADNVADPLYVAINGIAVAHEDPAAAQKIKWTEWNIPLQAFVDKGADVTNVTSIAIGIGNKTTMQTVGTGTMYFDDIGVH